MSTKNEHKLIREIFLETRCRAGLKGLVAIPTGFLTAFGGTKSGGDIFYSDFLLLFTLKKLQ